MKDYKKILEGVVDIINTTEKSDIGFANICTYIGENCPELKESEDERIRKALLNDFKNNCSEYFCAGINRDMVIAWLEKQSSNAYELGYTEGMRVKNEEWLERQVDKDKFIEKELGFIKSYRENAIKRLEELEKQAEKKPYVQRQECFDSQDNYAGERKGFCAIKIGEQKTANKIETKFKVGDWVVWDNKIFCHVENIYQGKESLMYTITDTNNMIRSYSVKGFDNNTRLWTIQDAKDGDVLAFDDETIVIFKDLYNTTTFHSYCYIEEGAFSSQDDMPAWWEGKGFHPATKEQRDTLIKAMTDAGYTFDFEKKELNKVEQKSAEWSEEDEKHRLNCLSYFNMIEKTSPYYEDYLWLKSLKDRYTWKPSNEQLKSLKEVIDQGHFTSYPNALETLYEQIKQL